MTVLMPNPEITKVRNIFKPYLVYSKKITEESYIREDAPIEVFEAYEEYKRLLQKEKELDELWMY